MASSGLANLNDAEQGIIGGLAKEFRIDSDDGVPGEAGADGGQFRQWS